MLQKFMPTVSSCQVLNHPSEGEGKYLSCTCDECGNLERSNLL